MRGGAAAVGLVLLLAGCGLKSDVDQLQAPAPAASSPSATAVASPSPSPSQPSPLPSPPPPPTISPEAPPPVLPSPGRLGLPTHDSDSTPAALLTGVRFATDGSCVWIVDAEAQRRAVLFPPGWSAAFSPLRLYDADGREVYREPRVLDVGGGASPVRVERIPEACRVGDTAWWLAPFEPASG